MLGEPSLSVRKEDAQPNGIAAGNKITLMGLLEFSDVHAGTNYLGRKHSITRIIRQRGLNSAENQKNEHDEKH